jgi:hypothetical protein
MRKLPIQMNKAYQFAAVVFLHLRHVLRNPETGHTHLFVVAMLLRSMVLIFGSLVLPRQTALGTAISLGCL